MTTVSSRTQVFSLSFLFLYETDYLKKSWRAKSRGSRHQVDIILFNLVLCKRCLRKRKRYLSVEKGLIPESFRKAKRYAKQRMVRKLERCPLNQTGVYNIQAFYSTNALASEVQH